MKPWVILLLGMIMIYALTMGFAAMSVVTQR